MSPEKSCSTKAQPDFVGPGGIPWFRTKMLQFHKDSALVDTVYGWETFVGSGSWFIHHVFQDGEVSGFMLSTATPDGKTECLYKTLDEALRAAMEQAVILKLRS